MTHEFLMNLNKSLFSLNYPEPNVDKYTKRLSKLIPAQSQQSAYKLAPPNDLYSILTDRITIVMTTHL